MTAALSTISFRPSTDRTPEITMDRILALEDIRKSRFFRATIQGLVRDSSFGFFWRYLARWS